jgi:hypothetical protein
MNKMIIFELISVIASVLLFRGFWILMDKLAWFNSLTGLLISIALGVIIMIWSLSHVNRCIGKN